MLGRSAKIMHIWLSYVIGIPLYCGAILPSLIVWLFPGMRKRLGKTKWTTLKVVSFIQCLAFAPYIYFSSTGHPDAMFALWLPAATGLISFFVSVILIIVACFQKNSNV